MRYRSYGRRVERRFPKLNNDIAHRYTNVAGEYRWHFLGGKGAACAITGLECLRPKDAYCRGCAILCRRYKTVPQKRCDKCESAYVCWTII